MIERGPLIELAGIDGSGKTTLARNLCGLFINSGRPAFVRGFHSWVRRWANGISVPRGLSRGQYVGHSAVEFAVALEYLELSKLAGDIGADGSVAIVEPFAINSAAVAAALEVKNLRAVVDAYLVGPAPDLIVHLDVGSAIAMARIRERCSGDNFLLDKEADSFIQRLHAAFETVIPMFQAAGRTVLTLDGEDSVQANVEATLHRLSEGGFTFVSSVGSDGYRENIG